MDNPETEISHLLARETVTVRKPEKGTNPKLFYIDGDKASLDPTETHKDSDYMWSSQSMGVGKYANYAADRKSELAAKQPQNLVQIESRKKKPARRVYDAPSKGVLWGWEVSAYVWTKAIAAGAFLIPVIGSYFVYGVPEIIKLIGALVAFVFLSITGVLLILDLGRPDRFLYVLFRPQWKSWLSRGSYIITIYGALLTAWLGAYFTGYTEFLKYIEPIGAVFALLSAIYTAFLFAQAKGRDFWQSPMLGLHMVLHSLMAGMAVFLITNVFLIVNVGLTVVLSTLASAFILVHLITLAIEMTTTHSTEDAHKVVKMILSGQFSQAFWIGMIAVGNVVPMLLLYFSNEIWAIGLSGVLILIGLGFAQHIWVKAPQLIPLS
jgi:formate-dependent nitrite reductase membrane component NrfD